MPVIGPSQAFAHQLADKIVDEFLIDLQAKHQVSAEGIGWMGSQHANEMRQRFEEQTHKMREAVREMVWLQHAADF
jgi:hypothetical protein